MRFLLILFFILSMHAQQELWAYRSNSSQDSTELNQTRTIKDVWGSMFIKNKSLRDSVRALVGKEMSKQAFEDLKTTVESNHGNNVKLFVYIYPVDEKLARIEIERTRKSGFKSEIRNYKSGERKRYRYDDNNDKYSYYDESEVNTWEWNGLMFPITDDEERLLIGLDLSSEYNFFRSFLGVRYQYESKTGNVFRIGFGGVYESIFNLNYSFSDFGNTWVTTNEKWDKNLILSPENLVNSVLPSSGILMSEMAFITRHHALRGNFGIQRISSAVPDSIDNSKARAVRGKIEYSMSYLDDKLAPMKGVYFNSKLIGVLTDDDEVKDSLGIKQPYRIGNRYSLDITRYGTYNVTAFANIQGLLPITSKSSVQLGAQAAYQEFNVSDAFLSPTHTHTAFAKQEHLMLSPRIGFRHKVEEETIAQVSFGVNHNKLTGKYNAEWQDYLFEAKISFGNWFEVRYTHIFDQKITEENTFETFNHMIHNQEGSVLSFAVKIGSLY